MANTDVIAKNLIETDKKELLEIEKQQKEVGTQLSEDQAVTPQVSQEDEEWEEFREHKKDLTGLKIEALTIQEAQPEEEEEETEINEDGEVVKVKKDGSGPWNKLGSTNETHQQQDLNHHHHVIDTSIQNTNVVGGSYVPPHLRGSAPQPRPTPGARRGKVAAPDLSSEVNFPSLAMASEEKREGGYDDGGKFEEVRDRGGQGYNTRQTDAPRISLGNRFAGLKDGD